MREFIDRVGLANVMHCANMTEVDCTPSKKEQERRAAHGRGVVVGVVATIQACTDKGFDEAWRLCLDIQPDIHPDCIPHNWPTLEEYKALDAQGPWMVVRNCCTSGNCGTCLQEKGHKYGQPVLVVGFHSTSKAKCEEVAKNWSAYHPKVVVMNETTITSLCPQSRTYALRELEYLRTPPHLRKR